MFTIREARFSDAGTLKRIHEQSVMSMAGMFYSPAVIRAWAAKSKDEFTRLCNESPCCAVAEIGGRIVAFGALHSRNTVGYLYVDPVWSGVGAAQHILAYLEEKISSFSERTAYVEAPLNAAGFYQRMGYRYKKEHVTHSAASARYVSYEMEKEIIPQTISRYAAAVCSPVSASSAA